MERKAPLSWKLKNALRWSFIRGWLAWHADYLYSYLTGTPALLSSRKVRLLKANGEVVDYGVVNWKLVTTKFYDFLVEVKNE